MEGDDTVATIDVGGGVGGGVAVRGIGDSVPSETIA